MISRAKIEKVSEEQWFEPSHSVEPIFSIDSSPYEGLTIQSNQLEDNLDDLFDETQSIKKAPEKTVEEKRKLIESLISLYFHDNWLKVFHLYLTTNLTVIGHVKITPCGH